MKYFSALLVGSVLVISNSFSVVAQKVPQLKTIIIDPGHGRPDIGAKGSFSVEADVTLAFAKRLSAKIHEIFPDTKVLFTRQDEKLPNHLNDASDANRLRAEFANEHKGDLFISIHADAVAPKYRKILLGTRERKVKVKDKKTKKVSFKMRKENVFKRIPLPATAAGSSVYIIAAHKSKDKNESIRENLEVLLDSNGSETQTEFNSPEIIAMASIWQKKFFKKSYLFASLIHEEFKRINRLSLGVKQRNKGIWVLQATSMPSVLIETGYICTNNEEVYINSEEGQEELMNAVVVALKNYKTLIESNTYVIPKEWTVPDTYAQQTDEEKDTLLLVPSAEREEKIYKTLKVHAEIVKVEVINNNPNDSSIYSIIDNITFIEKKQISHERASSFSFIMSPGEEVGLTLVANELVGKNIGSLTIKVYEEDKLVTETVLLVTRSENAAILIKRQ